MKNRPTPKAWQMTFANQQCGSPPSQNQTGAALMFKHNPVKQKQQLSNLKK
jgi:hypothetical protein